MGEVNILGTKVVQAKKGSHIVIAAENIDVGTELDQSLCSSKQSQIAWPLVEKVAAKNKVRSLASWRQFKVRIGASG